jgi:hypothetical protein
VAFEGQWTLSGIIKGDTSSFQTIERLNKRLQSVEEVALKTIIFEKIFSNGKGITSSNKQI